MNRPILYPNFSCISDVVDSSLVNLAGQYTRMGEITFSTETILRWVTINSEISLGNGTINAGSIAVMLGSGGASIGSMFTQGRPRPDVIFEHSSQQTLGPVTSSNRCLQLDMKNVLLNAGLKISLYFAASLTTPPPGNIAFCASVSAAFNSLVEWNNYHHYDK